MSGRGRQKQHLRVDTVSKKIEGTVASHDQLPVSKQTGPVSKKIEGAIASRSQQPESQRNGPVSKKIEGALGQVPPPRTDFATKQISWQITGKQSAAGQKHVGRSLRLPVKATPTLDAVPPALDDICPLQDRMQALQIEHPIEESSKTRYNVASSETAYFRALIDAKSFYHVDDHSAVAMADWDAISCQLRKDFCIVTALYFNVGGAADKLLICTCSASLQQRQRLLNIDNRQSVSVDFLETERNSYCIHRKIAGRLRLEIECEMDEDEDEDDPAVGVIEIIRNDPLMMWAVKDDTTRSYGVIRRSNRGSLKCLVCNKAKCVHVNYFGREHENRGFELPPKELDLSAVLKVILRKRIPQDGYILQTFKFPVEKALIPVWSNECCDHGHAWSCLDPVREEWMIVSTCTIYNSEGRPYDGLAVFYR